MKEKPYQVRILPGGAASIDHLMIDAKGDPIIESLTIRGLNEQAAQRVTVALNLAFQHGLQTAVKRIAHGLKEDPRAIDRLTF